MKQNNDTDELRAQMGCKSCGGIAPTGFDECVHCYMIRTKKERMELAKKKLREK